MSGELSIRPGDATHIERSEVAHIVGDHGCLQPPGACGNQEVTVVVRPAMRPDSRPKQSGVGPDRAVNVNPRKSLGECFELKKLPLGLLDQETRRIW